jgi:hypothetical protein
LPGDRFQGKRVGSLGEGPSSGNKPQERGRLQEPAEGGQDHLDEVPVQVICPDPLEGDFQVLAANNVGQPGEQATGEVDPGKAVAGVLVELHPPFFAIIKGRGFKGRFLRVACLGVLFSRGGYQVANPVVGQLKGIVMAIPFLNLDLLVSLSLVLIRFTGMKSRGVQGHGIGGFVRG